jgi:hypothetical protein
VVRGANLIYVTPGWWIFLSQQNQNNPSVGLEHKPQWIPALPRQR